MCCPREDAGRIADELCAATLAGTDAAGFRACMKVGVGETWADAERAAAWSDPPDTGRTAGVAQPFRPSWLIMPTMS